jgi:uncharacterized protein (TIGR00661 family)
MSPTARPAPPAAPPRSAPAPAPTARPLRVLFALQGEGRGHMTQAMAVATWLRARGHTVTGALVGASTRRRVPAFVRDGLGAPLHPIPSPNFAADARGGVRLGRTIVDSGRVWLSHFEPALGLIDRHVAAAAPDVVVNFYEGMTGYWALRRRPAVPIVALAHQFMFEHPGYAFAPGAPLQRAALRFYTRMAGGGAAVRLALSLYPAEPVPSKRLRPVPPVLRPEAHARTDGADDGSLLTYVMEPALAEGLKAWSARHPEVRLECFWDGPACVHGPGLRFHALDGAHFIERMARCRAVVCTAGFESVSEAMLLGKPVLMVPVPGHYEQACNALDGTRAGAGLAAEAFDLDRFLDYLPAYAPPPGFRAWAAGAEAAVVGAIEEAARAPAVSG